jgi:hypothetical protein
MVLLLVAASGLPYLVVWLESPSGTHFTGSIYNPADGNSYIAKMRQGLEGFWSFRLVYSPESHSTAYVYLYYILLGHLTKLLGSRLIVVYHLARLMGGASMLLAFYQFTFWLTDGVQEHPGHAQPDRQRRTMFLFASVGAGLGWLATPLGVVTPDMWVQEAFPAQAMLVNAHFPLAIALMTVSATGGLALMSDHPGRTPGWRYGLGMLLAALVLGSVQPFGLIPVFGGLGAMLMGRLIRTRVVPWRPLGWIAAAGLLALPYPAYMQFVMWSDPVLAAWNAQNITLSPPPWEWVLGYGLLAILAVAGVWVAVRRRSDGDWLLVGWLATTLLGMYLPLPLQRRLSLGLGVPMGMLAATGWWSILAPRLSGRRRSIASNLVVIFSAGTTVFTIVMALAAGMAEAPWFHVSEAEWRAFARLRDVRAYDAVVLCAPQTGIFVPAWAGQRVVYGHPAETVDAVRRKAQVEAYWAGEMTGDDRTAFLRENSVDFILVGPRELALGQWVPDQAGAEVELVFAYADVHLYRLAGGDE